MSTTALEFASPAIAHGEPLVVVRDLIKVYEGRADLVLKRISLEVLEGECFGLLGPNGAGKTTLMGCLLGLLNPDGGKITIGGIDPNDLSVREQIGFLPERPNFESWFTAFEYLSYHHALCKGPRETRKQDVENMLLKVDLDKQAWDRKIGKFSRGMLQRLGLAQALIGNPRILFLDEPGSGMDPPGVALLRELLLALKREKVTIILNSHHLDEMERICDRVAFLRDGKIQATKSLSTDSDYPHILRMRFGESNNLDLQQVLNEAATAIGATIVEIDRRSARIAVANGRMASEMIKCCVGRDLEIQAASPESTSLEHLFKDLPDLVKSESSLEQESSEGIKT